MNNKSMISMQRHYLLTHITSLCVRTSAATKLAVWCLRRLFVIAAITFLGSLSSYAAIDDAPEFKTEAQEAQYYSLIKEIRCPTCQNNNVAESNAPLARQLRQQIVQQIQQGKDNDTIRAYLIARYGDFISYRPPFNAHTWLLWLLPVILMIIALFIWLLIRGRQRQIASLTPEQQAELRKILLESRQRDQDEEHKAP